MTAPCAELDVKAPRLSAALPIGTVSGLPILLVQLGQLRGDSVGGYAGEAVGTISMGRGPIAEPPLGAQQLMLAGSFIVAP
ncbi:hypothetical protein [Streptomyces sp. NPDC058373]|uniref:hypothetical protein n=1 Tax=Streptomyces sp. NPDC058373 TaxID=3346465 RepID=UPI00364AB10B